MQKEQVTMYIQHTKNAQWDLYTKLYTMRKMLEKSEKQLLLEDVRKSLHRIQKLNESIIYDFMGITDRTAQIEKLLEIKDSSNENVL